MRLAPGHVRKQQVDQAQVRVYSLNRPVLLDNEAERPSSGRYRAIKVPAGLLHNRLIQYHPREQRRVAGRREQFRGFG